MKILLTILICALCVSSSFAQDDLNLTVGAGIPSGDFANTSDGAAKTGISADLLYQHGAKADSKLLIAGEFRYQSFGVNTSQLQQSFSGANVTSTNWSAISVLVGPVLKVNMSDVASFEPRLMVGYMSVKTPSLTISGSGISGGASSNSAGAFATLIGMNFKFKVAENTKFVVGLDYLTANPKFSGSSSGGQDFNQQINSFNISLGIAFKL